MPVNASALERARAETLQGLAEALSALAARMRSRDSVARDFARLVVRAERIASQAYLLKSAKSPLEDNAKALAAELSEFHASVVEAAARVRAEASGNAAVADVLSLHARRITQVARVAGPLRSKTLRAELQPLATTLTAMQGRIDSGSVVIRDTDALAQRAAGLADEAVWLLEGGETTRAVATAIHQALRGFVDEAGSISKRMSGVSAGLGTVADQMALCTREMSGGHPPPAELPVVVWHRA